MNKPTTRTELIIELKNQFDSVLKSIGWDDPQKPYGVSISIENPDSEDEIQLKVGYFYILISENLENRDKYHLSKEETIRGSYYLPNGDPGFPDELDLIYIGVFRTSYEVICAVVAELAQDFIDITFEELHILALQGRT